MITLHTLTEIADLLRYTGNDRERSVRRLFQRYGVSIMRRDRGTFLATDQQLAALLEAMKCSQSANAAKSGTAAARSVSVGAPASSKSTLRAAIAEKMPKPTGRSSRPKRAGKCFTVVPGGRSE